MKLQKLPFEDVAYDVRCERMGLDAGTKCSGESNWPDGICKLVGLHLATGYSFDQVRTIFL